MAMVEQTPAWACRLDPAFMLMGSGLIQLPRLLAVAQADVFLMPQLPMFARKPFLKGRLMGRMLFCPESRTSASHLVQPKLAVALAGLWGCAGKPGWYGHLCTMAGHRTCEQSPFSRSSKFKAGVTPSQ